VMGTEAVPHSAGATLGRYAAGGAGDGTPGPKGDKGDTGETGPAGPQGPEGPAGPQGETGPEGPQGETGPAGPEGPQGPEGAEGPEGPPGEQGPQGETGPAGQDGSGGQAFPVGAVFISVVSTDPATLLGYGTWSAFGAGRVLVGRDSGDTDFDTAEETGGAKTKAISAHAGTAVADHSVTQPTAAGEAAHTHTYTQVVNHVHNQTRLPTATGGVTGFTVDTSMSGTPATSGVDTGNPTGGVATGTTAAGASHTHTMSGTAVSAHSVTQPSGHTDLNVVQPYIVVYMWKRTA
jgi:hypothetical protein